jgi:hypothetical protein
LAAAAAVIGGFHRRDVSLLYLLQLAVAVIDLSGLLERASEPRALTSRRAASDGIGQDLVDNGQEGVH